MNMEHKAFAASSIIIHGQRYTPDEYRAMAAATRPRAVASTETRRFAPPSQDSKASGRHASMRSMVAFLAKQGIKPKMTPALAAAIAAGAIPRDAVR